jgi:hypothetical protein
MRDVAIGTPRRRGVLAGISTSGVVLSTRVLLEKVLARQATVVKVADVTTALGGA